MTKKVKTYRIDASGPFYVEVLAYNAKDARKTFWDAVTNGFEHRLADRGAWVSSPELSTENLIGAEEVK